MIEKCKTLIIIKNIKIKNLIINSRIFNFWRKLRIGYQYFFPKFRLINTWAWGKSESDNFYYDLKDKNRKDMISLLSWILNIPIDLLVSYHKEIIENESLKRYIEYTLKKDPKLAEIKVGFARREAWYVIARAIKPKVVIETGVHHGVGSCVLTSALKKNSEEGFPGEYYGIDIDKSAGFLLNGTLCKFGKIIYSDSLEALNNFERKIDLFINDSDHSVFYEGREYELIKEKLSHEGIILGDNSHTNSVLRDFSLKENRGFVFFKEEPADHWYPGAGVGISMPRKQ